MDYFHSSVREHAAMVVITLDRCRCEGFSPGLAERTVPGLPHFGRDGDALSASPPRSRRRQTPPEARVRRRKVAAHGDEGRAVRDVLHRDLLFAQRREQCHASSPLARRSNSPIHHIGAVERDTEGHAGRYQHFHEHSGGGRTGQEDIALIQRDNGATYKRGNNEAPSHGLPPWSQGFDTCGSIAVEESAQQRDTKRNERGKQRFEYDPTRYLPGKA